ncbi:ArsR/SmtB family transcription factor [Eubacterium sp.]|uniref:ArsR/SmtB family transcription factor n=1 Tax=Eubacterium sp. TaxID=142586 RepID=UPI003F05A7C3
MTIDEKRIALIFKALCDENRVRIIRLLGSGEKCACKLLDELNITQPTLSHHMKILCDSEIVVGRKEGKWMHYSLSVNGVEKAKEILNELTDTSKQDKQQEGCCQ